MKLITIDSVISKISYVGRFFQHFVRNNNRGGGIMQRNIKFGVFGLCIFLFVLTFGSILFPTIFKWKLYKVSLPVVHLIIFSFYSNRKKP